MSAVERLANALKPVGGSWLTRDDREAARRILAADPDLAADLELGQAFRETVAALPDEPVSITLTERVVGDEGWVVRAGYVDARAYRAEGPTPAAALRALKEALAK